MVSAENFVMPSRVRPTISSTETPGLRNIVLAEALMRAQCRSRSGATPSNTLAPSNTDDPSQIACVRAPHNGTLPSCQASSKYVQVFDQPCPGVIDFLQSPDTIAACAGIVRWRGACNAALC